jgi:hypothetical protein
VIREVEFRPSSGLTIIVVIIIITVTVAPPRSMRTSMQLLSPVWEDYTPPPFCGNRLDDDDPIISSFAPTTATTTTEEEEDEEKTTCSSNATTTAEQSNKIDATIVAAVIALFVIIREKLLQWSKPKVRSISRDVRKRKPVKIVCLQRTPKKAAAAAGRNNNNNNKRQSRKPPAHRHRWTVRSMNPLRVLAKIPEAYVNMMNGVGRSPAFSSPGMTTFHVVSHNHFPPRRTRDHDLDVFSSREYYYTSDESIAEILHLDSRRSTSNSKPVDRSDYAAAMDQYYYHYRSSSISPGPDSSASSLDSNAARGMNIHNFRRSNSTTKFRDRCDLQFLNS